MYKNADPLYKVSGLQGYNEIANEIVPLHTHRRILHIMLTSSRVLDYTFLIVSCHSY